MAEAISIGVKAFLRHVFTVTALLAIVVAGLYLSAGRLSSSFKDVIEQKVNEKLAGSGLQVRFEDIQFVEGEGIRIDSLEVFLSDAVSDVSPVVGQDVQATRFSASSYLAGTDTSRMQTYRPKLKASPDATSMAPNVSMQQLWLKGAWSPAALLSGKFQPQSIELVSPTIQATLRSDGSLVLPKFRLPTSDSGPPETIRIKNGQIELNCEKTPGKLWTFTLPQLEIRQGPRPDSLAPTDARVDLRSIPWEVTGDLSLMGLPAIRFNGGLRDQRFELQAVSQPTHFHSGFWQELSPWLPAQLQVLEGTSGWIQLQEFSLAGNLPGTPTADAARTPSRPLLDHLNLRGRLEEVQFQNPALPQPVLNVSGSFSADLAGARIDTLKGRIGDGTFQLDGRVENWNSPRFVADLNAKDLRFTRRWVPLLPEKLQHDWAKFQPEGLVSCKMNFQQMPDGTISKTGTVDVYNLNYVFADFPVPISGAAGRFVLKNRDCTFELGVDNQLYPMEIDGFANDMGPHWTGRVNIKSTRYHTIDDSLLLGLQKKPQAIRVIRDLNPSGMMAVNGFVEKKIPDQKADVQFNIAFHSGVVQHQKFPYRIFGIRGPMEYKNGQIEVKNLEGVSSTGNIRANGRFAPNQPWHVQLVGHAVELNTELYQAMNPTQREIWDHIRPRGVLDEVVVDLYEQQGEVKTRISASQQLSSPADPSNLSINPDWFPYQLNHLSGKFAYVDNKVFLSDVHGSHGKVRVAFDGEGLTSLNGWELTIKNLLAGQIPFDQEIKAALPETVKNAVEQLQLVGSVSVQGAVKISRESSRPEAQVAGAGQNPAVHRLPPSGTQTYRMQDSGIFQRQAPPVRHRTTMGLNSGAKLAWDLRLDMEDAALQVGLPAEHVHGMIRLRGHSSTSQAYCHGDLQIDSAIVQGIQVTRIEGPIGMNEREIVFGTQVRPLALESGHGTNTPPVAASVTMQSMGGTIGLDGRVLLLDDMPFRLQTTVNHLDLKKMATTFAPETKDVAGLGNGSLTLHGSSLGVDTLTGGGNVRIQDARLYEVPLFLQLLKVLRVRKPDKTAFDEGYIEFKIAGEDIELKQIELKGDAISLLGRGQANLNQEIDLDFYTVLGRNELTLPLISHLLHMGSQQLLWITVDGTIANPDVTHETGRAINETVRLLFEDLEAASKLND